MMKFLVMPDRLILVDDKDNEIGIEEKMEAHRQGKLHRAFSIFVFNSKKQMLLQKRAVKKYHSGGLWTNTCCSHPQPNEGTEEAAHRRLKEEMGFDCDLTKVTSFIYKSDFGNGLTEHEFDHVFIGFFDGDIVPNKDEVDEFKFVDINELKNDIGNNPESYTTWFRIAMDKVNWESIL